MVQPTKVVQVLYGFVRLDNCLLQTLILGFGFECGDWMMSLHELVLRLCKLELRHGFFHVIHVFGKQMIAQGTDGCSCGVLLEGVMAGEDMLSFIELGKSAIECSPSFLPWIQSWCLDS